MKDKYYLRIDGNSFGFVVDDIHKLNSTDIPVIEDDYKEFFKLQSQGKQFRLKEIPTGTGLFDYIEEYIPEQPIQEPGQDEFNLDIEYRLSKLELGV